jgi:hypothetical protein
MLSVSFVVLGVLGGKIQVIYVADSGSGFDGDSNCGCGSSVTSNSALLLFFIYLRAHCVLMMEIAVC